MGDQIGQPHAQGLTSILRSRTRRQRAQTPRARTGYLHSVSLTEGMLDDTSQVAPTVMARVAPNAPIAMCGGTLVAKAPDMAPFSLPPCPDCAVSTAASR